MDYEYLCAQRPKRIFLFLKNQQKPQKLAKLSVIPEIPPRAIMFLKKITNLGLKVTSRIILEKKSRI